VSVDGVVVCDCFEAGAAVPAPCPVKRSGAWLVPAPGYEAMLHEVVEWNKRACQHPWCFLVDHQVRKMALLEAMATYGAARTFPVIHAKLPTCNGGQVSPTESARCLAEFDHLGALMSERSMVVIADADTGEVVFVDPDDEVVADPRHHSPGPAIYGYDRHRAVIGLTPLPDKPMTSTWLDDDAVVRLVDAHGSVLLETREFVQERTNADWTFRDERTGKVVHHCSPVSFWDGTPKEDRPHRMRAEVRPVDIDNYVSGVAELRELFTTSVRTGRPIYWV
jgi:hypothetical protein